MARESSVAREMIMLEGAETSSASEMVTSAAMTATAAKTQPCQMPQGQEALAPNFFWDRVSHF